MKKSRVRLYLKSKIRLLTWASCRPSKVLVVWTMAVIVVNGCRSAVNTDDELKKVEERQWGNNQSSLVDFHRIKLIDKNGHELDPSVLQKPFLSELKISLDGQVLAGDAPAFIQLQFYKRLAGKLSTNMDGSFLNLPWANTTARVGGFTAINLEDDPDKVLLCGGDESPNRVRFTADKTWLVDLASGQVQAGPDMNWPRTYPTLTRLLDGKILISGGSGGLTSGGLNAGSLSNNENLASTTRLAKLTPELEIYDPKTNTISSGGSMKIARDETTAVVLGNGLVLIAGGDRARQENESDSGVPESFQAALEPVTAELYNPAKQQSIMLGRLKSLTAITWAAHLGTTQAVLLGPHWGMHLGDEQLGEPSAELIDTARK
jgi:hypothetical protein